MGTTKYKSDIVANCPILQIIFAKLSSDYIYSCFLPFVKVAKVHSYLCVFTYD